jgi:hypothetical protein
MAAILIHMVLVLDLTGCQDVHEAIDHFLHQADLAKVHPKVESHGKRCTIRYTVEGPATLTGLRQTLKHLPKGLCSDVSKAVIQNLKHRPDEFTVELLVPPSGWRL